MEPAQAPTGKALHALRKRQKAAIRRSFYTIPADSLPVEVEMVDGSKILPFFHGHYIFSNFYVLNQKFEYKGTVFIFPRPQLIKRRSGRMFPTSEHAYFYEYARRLGHHAFAENIVTKNWAPSTVKCRARELPAAPHKLLYWEREKYTVSPFIH
jgi:hypothetical protein